MEEDYLDISGADRPTWRCDSLLRSVARELVRQFSDVADDDEDSISAVMEAVRSEGPIFDAYRIARHLDDRYSWNCSSDTVDVCESASILVFEKVRAATARWVARNCIVPAKEVGQAVRVTTRGEDFVRREYDGFVASINAEQAQYSIRIPALGHVESGLGVHGIILPFEEVHSIVAPVEQFALRPCS